MANPKYHWAVPVLDPSKCRNAWKAHSGGHYARACGRRYANAAFPDSAADFVNRAKRDPDWHCLDCAKAARLALAAESAPNPDITARSLVGMSASAKKRAARALFVKHVLTSQGTEIKPDDQGPRWFHLWCRGSGDVASRDPDYAALRDKYRIGERLRPCPGCSLCKGVGCCACCPKFDQDCDACVDGLSFLCDGSGVLPARKQK